MTLRDLGQGAMDSVGLAIRGGLELPHPDREAFLAYVRAMPRVAAFLQELKQLQAREQEANPLKAENQRLAELQKSCPCQWTAPCEADCTCAQPGSSHGCARCCRWGSDKQRRGMAEHLAGLVTENQRLTQLEQSEEEWATIALAHEAHVVELLNKLAAAEAVLAALGSGSV